MPRFTFKARRIGTVHIVRYWTVYMDGRELDHYEDRSLAEGYCNYMNARDNA